jgi:hypothetical protein
MNAIFQTNMQAMLRAEKFVPPPAKIRVFRLHADSKSKKIIEYLLIHGKTSGSDLMAALGLESSPKAVIQPHLQSGRLICERVSSNRANYSINPALTAVDFGLSE